MKNIFSKLTKNEDLKQSLLRSWAMSWPMILIMFFEFLIQLADVIIAGKIGKEIQATYGFVTQIYFIFTVIGNAFTIGTVSVISRLCSLRGNQEYKNAIYSSLLSSATAGAILAVAGIILSPRIIRLMSIPDELKNYGAPLLVIYAGGALFHYILITTNGILRACQGIKKSLKTMALASLINVTLNIIFVFYTPLGYKGIALSTAISVAVGALVNLGHLREYLFGIKNYTKSVIVKIVKIGWPSGLLQITWQISTTVLFLILGSLPENNVEIIAAFTNGYRIEAIIFLPAFALNMANAVVIGNLMGEDNTDGAFKNGQITALLGLGIVALLSTTIILNARWILSFLSDNQTVIDYSVKYIFISLPFEPVMAWGVILAGGLNGAGDTKSVMIRVALSVWLVRVPFSFIFGILLGWGAYGVWWAMNASLLVQAILISERYWKRRWLKNAI